MLTSLFAHLGELDPGQFPTLLPGVLLWGAATLIYRRGWKASSAVSRRRFLAFAVGSALLVAALSPPLEHLAGELVSAHMVQHISLILVAAPLIAVSRPVHNLMRALPTPVRKRIGGWRRRARLTPTTISRLGRPLIVWLSYALVLWFWHGAVPYQAAVRHEVVHLLEHGTFLVAAFGFWGIVLSSEREVGAGYRLLMVFTTAFHSVLLGALITFADSPWYPLYSESAAAFGLDPVTDQQLAGLLMWIPGGLIYTGVGLWLLTDWIRTEASGAAVSFTSPDR